MSPIRINLRHTHWTLQEKHTKLSLAAVFTPTVCQFSKHFSLRSPQSWWKDSSIFITSKGIYYYLKCHLIFYTNYIFSSEQFTWKSYPRHREKMINDQSNISFTVTNILLSPVTMIYCDLQSLLSKKKWPSLKWICVFLTGKFHFWPFSKYMKVALWDISQIMHNFLAAILAQLWVLIQSIWNSL